MPDEAYASDRRKLADLVTVLSGFPAKKELFNEDGDGIPLVRIRDLEVQSPETFYSGDFEHRYVLSDGDLLVGMDGAFKVVLWGGGTALLNQRVCRVSSASPLLSDGFLRHLLERMMPAIEQRTAKTTVKHLSVNDITEIEFDLPPIPEQLRIADLMSAVDDQLDALRHAREQTKTLRSALLQDLLSGAHRIPESYDRLLNKQAAPDGSNEATAQSDDQAEA